MATDHDGTPEKVREGIDTWIDTCNCECNVNAHMLHIRGLLVWSLRHTIGNCCWIKHIVVTRVHTVLGESGPGGSVMLHVEETKE